MASNSLYNNTFLPEATRCNFEDLKVYGPFQGSYEDPSEHHLQKLQSIVDNMILSLLSPETINSFCKQIFNYRIAKAESFIKNMYDFFYVLLYKPVKFTYSPQFGIALWPGKLPYVRLPIIETIVQPLVSSLFMDYITETTTFLRYHIKFRFDHVFHITFKKQFCQQVIECLLSFTNSINKMHTMKNGIETALLLLQINHSKQHDGI